MAQHGELIMEKSYEFVSLVSQTPLVFHEAFAPNYPAPEKYLPAKGLCEAIDSAILLGMPLLLTGEPGSGKTQAARWLAWRLGARLLRHDVKSITSGRDLLYSFDEVARFRDASAGKAQPLIDYVTFSALGEAIIRTLGGEGSIQPLRLGGAIPPAAFGGATNPSTACLLPRDPHFVTASAEHCVVLIDELDKAPRDTPNDLLAEVETMSFEMPELGIRIEADSSWRAVLLITSNSERALPEPFLRRCLFFDIPMPDQDTMAEIVANSIADVNGRSPLFSSAWSYYNALRNLPTIRKKPGTAELLAWIDCLKAHAGLSVTDFINPESAARILPTLACIAKSPEDMTLARGLLEAGWQSDGARAG